MKHALTYLNDLQSKCYAYLDVPSTTARDKLANFVSLIPKLKENFVGLPEITQAMDNGSILNRLNKLCLPTPHTDPFTFFILDSIRDEIEDSIKALSNTTETKLIMGTLPTGRLNAMAIRIPSTDEFIIAFDECVILIVTAISQVILIPLYSGRKAEKDGFIYSLSLPQNDDDIYKLILKNPSCMKLFMSALYPYLLEPLPRLANYIPPENAVLNLKNVFQTSMEMFLLGHEYAHVALGHLSSKYVNKSTFAGESIEEIVEDWEHEIQADILGFQAMLLTMNKRGNAPLLPFAAVNLLFTIFNILEKAVAILQSGDENKRHCLSHPPPVTRRETLRQIASECLDDKTLTASLVIADVTQATADVLWREIRPFLYDGRNRDWKLAKKWEL